MMRLLITGATGMLGRALLVPASRAGLRVRIASRTAAKGTAMLPSHARGAPDGVGAGPAAIERVEIDLTTGRGLEEALEDVDVVVHAASSPRGRSREVDEEGTHRLLDVARHQRVRHLIYPSIVGIDRIDWPYYRHKLAAERAIGTSGLPYSVVRGTQFHAFVDDLLHTAHRLPVALVPRGVVLQSVDETEYARAILERLTAGPSGAVEEVAGPEILALEAMTEVWRRARGVHGPMLRIPVPGALVRGLRAGGATSRRARRGSVTWQAWLDAHARGRGGDRSGSAA